jgi:hypothetical protein
MISIANNTQRLSSEAVRYWKKAFLANLKIGVEIEFATNGIGQSMKEQLKNKFNATGKTLFSGQGVYDVTGDGSIPQGVELKTCGRRLDFLNLYIQYKYYMDEIKDRGFITERCGLHNHVLMDYNGEYTSLEQPVPGIIFKNFMQLLRRFAPELVWITSTIKHDSCITRYDGYCRADTMYQYTPVNKTAQSYISALVSSDRYRFANCIPMRVVDDQINRFHFELRFPDGSLWSAQIAAQNILYGALLIKAIELSELGIIDTGTVEEWEQTKMLYRAIRQQHGAVFGDNRYSDPPTQEQINIIRNRAINTLKFLKSCISQYDTRAYRVLMFLAQEPISIMRRTKTDLQINQDFHELIKSMYVLDTSPFDSLINAINTMSVSGAVSPRQWTYQYATKTGKSFQEVEMDITKLEQIKQIAWDNELGTFVFK